MTLAGSAAGCPRRRASRRPGCRSSRPTRCARAGAPAARGRRDRRCAVPAMLVRSIARGLVTAPASSARRRGRRRRSPRRRGAPPRRSSTSPATGSARRGPAPVGPGSRVARAPAPSTRARARSARDVVPDEPGRPGHEGRAHAPSLVRSAPSLLGAAPGRRGARRGPRRASRGSSRGWRATKQGEPGAGRGRPTCVEHPGRSRACRSR